MESLYIFLNYYLYYNWTLPLPLFVCGAYFWSLQAELKNAERVPMASNDNNVMKTNTQNKINVPYMHRNVNRCHGNTANEELLGSY